MMEPTKKKKPAKKNNDVKQRIEFATKQLESNNIEFVLKNAVTGHFHCRKKSDDTLVQFYAGTGTIMGHDESGIHNLITLLVA